MTKSILEHIDSSQPQLSYAVELQNSVAKVGFDWDNTEGVISKVHEELNEVIDEIGIENNQQRLLDEIGDLLFVCSSLARHLHVDPQKAITHANQKFYRRFSQLEQLAVKNKLDIKQCSLDELDGLWDEVKRLEKQDNS